MGNILNRLSEVVLPGTFVGAIDRLSGRGAVPAPSTPFDVLARDALLAGGTSPNGVAAGVELNECEMPDVLGPS